MGKGYWISSYKKIINEEQFQKYADLAQAAVLEGGGTFLVRGGEVEAFQEGLAERTVVVEFNNFESAKTAYNSSTYKRALCFLENSAVRDFRIAEGVIE